MTKQTPDKLNIDLSSDVLSKALGRARSLGLTITEYVQSLVEKDVQEKKHDPWLEPVPPEVEARWNKDIAETEEYEKTHPRPAAKSAAEFRQLLEKEIAELPDDERD